jgi:hypothetical protein
MLLPPDTGIPVEPGSLLVLQMHYHPTGTGPEQDATAIALKLLDEEPASYALAALIGNDNHAEPGGDGLQPGPNDPESGPAFVIPPGAKGHTESMVYTVPPVVGSMELPVFRIFAVASHMHYVGTDMVINLKRKPAGVAACPDGELGPLVACISTNCDGLSGGELQDCAIDHCVADYLALSTACSQCTLANAKSGDVAEIQAACEKIDELEGPPQADQECLLQTPQWNFEWQRFYEYDLPVDELPTVRPGDRLEFRCTYDNSMDNPFVAEALEYQGLDAPIEVKLGETTLDEMCLVALQLIYPAPAKQ